MKKTISIMLAFILALSCFSAGFVAGASPVEDLSAAINGFDLDALTLSGSFMDQMDADQYPDAAMAAAEALFAAYNALPEADVCELDPEDYIRLVEIVYQAKRWSDWDAAGRSTDLMTIWIAFSAWQDAGKTKFADAANRLDRLPDLRKLPRIRDFLSLMESVEVPYTNTDVANAKEAYAAVPAVLWKELLADDADGVVSNAIAVYKAVLAAVGPDAQSDNVVDLSVYERMAPGEISVSEKTTDRIFSLLSAFGVDADSFLAEKVRSVATGQTVVSLMCALAGVHELMAVLVPTANVAAALEKDPKFSGAAEKLRTMAAEGHSALVEKTSGEEAAVIWSADQDPAVSFTSEDFGFADGDLYGFIDALAASLGSADGVISILGTFRNTRNTEQGIYIYGKYEELIPLLELLDLPVLSSAAFTEAVESARYTGPDGAIYEDKVRAGVNAILTPFADYLTDTFFDSPAKALLELLPKLCYAIDSGSLNDTAGSLLSVLAGFGVSIDLTAEGVWQLLSDKILSEGVDFNGDGEKEMLPIDRDGFTQLVHRLAYSADPVVKSSVSAHNANRLGLDCSEADAASVLLSAIAEIVQTDEGKAFVNSLFANSNASGIKAKLLEKIKTALCAEGGLKKLISCIGSPLYWFILFFARIAALFSRISALCSRA